MPVGILRLAFAITEVHPYMDIDKMLAELRVKRGQIEEAIEALERLAGSKKPRRGRPPKWLKEAECEIASSSESVVPKKPLDPLTNEPINPKT
jgi:hypothetical protein